MLLGEEDIKNFQKIFKEQFGKEISKEDAYEKGVKLLQLMSVIYKPMTEKEYEFIQKHRIDTLHLLEEKLKNNI